MMVLISFACECSGPQLSRTIAASKLMLGSILGIQDSGEQTAAGAFPSLDFHNSQGIIAS
jgi:hypothetical protein